MDSKHYTPEQIEAWLQHALPEQEAAEFREQLNTDPELAEAVSLHQLALAAGKHLSEDHLRENVLSWTATMAPESPTTVPAFFRKKNWMPIAGIVLLMLLLFLFYFSFDKEQVNKAPSEPTPDLLQPGSPNSSPPIVKTPDEVPQQENISPGSPIPSAQQLATLARKFYPKPDNWASGTRSGELSPSEQLVDSLYKQALAGFYQQRLKEAEKNAGAAFAADSSFVEALRLLAHIHFRQGKFKAASRDFEKMKTRYRSRAEEAEWNLLLCLYARYQEPAARKAFGQLIQKIINNTDHAYNHHAIEFREAVSQVTSTGINPPD